MTLCLERGDELHINSMAFPALGTGFLNFPAKNVVRRFVQCVKDFEMSHKSTSLTEIRFVIFPKDTKTFEEFENEFNRYSYSILCKPGSEGIYHFIGVFEHFFFSSNFNEIKHPQVLKFFVGNLSTKPKDVECSLDSLMIKLVAGILVNQKVMSIYLEFHSVSERTFPVL